MSVRPGELSIPSCCLPAAAETARSSIFSIKSFPRQPNALSDVSRWVENSVPAELRARCF